MKDKLEDLVTPENVKEYLKKYPAARPTNSILLDILKEIKGLRSDLKKL